MSPTKSILLLFFTSALAGCAARPDPAAKVEGVNRALIDADVVMIHPVSINGAHSPEGTLETAINRLRPFLRGEVRVAPLVEKNLPTTVPASPVVRLSDIPPSPTDITLAYVPSADGVGRGLYTRYADGHQQIVFSVVGVAAMKGPFFSERAAWTLVQTHELGHVLGVPADASHAWKDGHCTNPRCVMYPEMDFRSGIAAVFVLGPPRNFCAACRAELMRR
jgi:hypothetical protein